MSSILSEDRRARTRRGGAVPSTEAQDVHESSDDDPMSEDDEFVDAGEDLSSNEEDQWTDAGSDNESQEMERMERKTKEVSPAQLEARQQQLRRQIFEIQKDTKLSVSEKSKLIQQLMTSGYQTNGKSREDKFIDLKPGEARPEDTTVTWNDKDEGVMGCKHYRRDAKLQANCCNKWVSCRFCHDENSDHTMNRHETKNMMCMHCFTVQDAAQSCHSCNKRLARYYCSECKLWDNDPRKSIYHCKDCGICRIGRGLGDDFFHCTKCNVCMAIGLQGSHKCIERNLESDCPICGEYMFTSTTTVIFMPCGHCIHFKCHEEYIQTSYQCPTCFKSLANMTEYFNRIDNMLAQHTMPPEYANWVSWILCNDCEKKSYAKYHFLYHKCEHCGSYNTKTIKTYEQTPVEGQRQEQ